MVVAKKEEKPKGLEVPLFPEGEDEPGRGSRTQNKILKQSSV